MSRFFENQSGRSTEGTDGVRLIRIPSVGMTFRSRCCKVQTRPRHISCEILQLIVLLSRHHNVINWKHFPRYWPFVRGNSPVTGEFPSQRPVTLSFDVFFDLRLNKRLSKQWWGWWFETPSHPLWHRCNGEGRRQVDVSRITGSHTKCH